MAKLSAKYEVLYIIDPAQGEEGIAALVEKFKGIVEAHGTLTSVDEWGKRRLAYPINDLVEGYYVYMTCEVTPEMPAELELDHVAPARNIEHSGRLHGRSRPPLIRFQREQIQKHLQVLPVQQLCIIKILMAGLVIDDTEIAPSVRLIGVHAVDLPG